jgi:Lrp/AsnC family transcriptional regulator for asnA, asnC and gidA
MNDAAGSEDDRDSTHGSLDEVDQGILRLLQVDGRMPLRQIGRELGVSEGTVRFRLRRMEDSGALSIVAVADPFRMGYRVLAFCLLRTDPERHNAVVQALSALQETTYVSSCTGEADLYIQLVCVDHDHLWHLLYERIPAIGGVLSTATYMELKMHKVSYGYPHKVSYSDTVVRPSADS